MPRPWFSASALSLCCRTMVRTAASVAASSCSTSAPMPGPVEMLAVPSPGSGGVMKRVTYSSAPSAETDTCRAFEPTAALPSDA